MKGVIIVNKKDAINEILYNIYSKETPLILSENEISSLNNYYKNTFNKVTSYTDFLYGSSEATRLIAKMQSGKFEIEKQFNNQKGLQPAILTECNYAQTIASIFQLTECIDLDIKAFNDIPIECIDFIKSSKNTISAARYLYYSKKDKDKFLVQYGNPDAGDASIIYYQNDIKLEFKESNAKAGEYDLLVNENGKLLPSDKIQNTFPLMQQYIDEFNKQTSLFNYLGSNYKIEKTDKFNPIVIAKNYFNNNGIDLLVTSVNNELIAIDPSDLTLVFKDGTLVATTEGSEIRTTGKNDMQIELIEYFRNTINSIAVKTNGNTYVLNKKDIDNLPGYGYIKERGKDKIGRVKLNYMFFVRIKDISETEDTISFSINDVRQTKPTISIHIKIVTDKEHLKSIYLNKSSK